jgi:hypothetical protein
VTTVVRRVGKELDLLCEGNRWVVVCVVVGIKAS